MDKDIIIAVCTICSNVISIIVGIQLIKYRVEQLEKKVEKHNAFYDKVNELQKSDEINKVEHRNFDKRLTTLEEARL